ncbi:hypothetical protein PR048_006227 [Dryococelus australis]|uniref:Uncharacterized protein n=1 Tax=Dryococelus australis TaxID=614101 RepID=A0ABQ9IAD1_9NEOP|nr:hypothetical protein PR048_006227 [Dryococelus australis]
MAISPGCLPEPLLKRDFWSNAASQSSVAVQHVRTDGVIVRPVHKIIARSVSALPGEQRSVLASLVELIRNLSTAAGRESMLHEQQCVRYLIHYFAASLSSRPYFTGILTTVCSKSPSTFANHPVT